jgi:hypothetical protein
VGVVDEGATGSVFSFGPARSPRLVSEQAIEREHRITPLELFFDLVFVFALTQVTIVFSEETSWAELAHGLLHGERSRARGPSRAASRPGCCDRQ